MKKLTNVLAVLIMLANISCSTTSENEASDKTEMATSADGWIWLFDGQSAEGWRGFNSESLPEGWVVEEGTLKSLGAGGDIGGDIVSDDEYANFDLKLEWKISPEGNSGIFYHVKEGKEYKALYYTAPEYQLIDDVGFPSKASLVISASIELTS